MLYEFADDFGVDDSEPRERFGLTATALADVAASTVAWSADRAAQSAATTASAARTAAPAADPWNAVLSL